MTLEVKEFESLPKLMANLEALALSNEQIVFRGHRDADWKIGSTLARYTSIPHHNWDTHIDDMLSHFIVNALSIGTIPFPPGNRRSRLEYGRHYGVPTPVIDFSWSPYVALHFAVSGIQFKHDKPPSNAAVYALNIHSLAHCWSKLLNDSTLDVFGNFMHEAVSMFEHGYPAGELKFMRFPASWNQRMQRQLGCFVYDTLDYSDAGVGGRDFEGWVQSFVEPKSPDHTRHPTLTKFLLPHLETGRVLSRLELMNINGTKLIDTEGLASDVISTYNYTRKTGYAWDMVLPPPDDTEI